MDNQNKQIDINMKENVSYEVPSSVMMTDCAAYGTLPNMQTIASITHNAKQYKGRVSAFNEHVK